MAATTNRSRVAKGVPTGGEFAREQRGENGDLTSETEIVQVDARTWAFGGDTRITLSDDPEFNPGELPEGFLEDRREVLQKVRDTGLRGDMELEKVLDEMYLGEWDNRWFLRTRLPHSGKTISVLIAGGPKGNQRRNVADSIVKVPQELTDMTLQEALGTSLVWGKKDQDGDFRLHGMRVQVKDTKTKTWATPGTHLHDGEFIPLVGFDGAPPEVDEETNWALLGEAFGEPGGRAKVEAKLRSAIASIDTHPDVVWFNEGRR